MATTLEEAWEEADQGVECWRVETAGRAGAARQTAVPKLIVVPYDQQLTTSSALGTSPCGAVSPLHHHGTRGMLKK